MSAFKGEITFCICCIILWRGLWVKRANRALCFAESTLHENKVR